MQGSRRGSGFGPQGGRGQSTVEYLVISSVVVAVILLVAAKGGKLDTSLTALYTNAANKVKDAAACIAKLPVATGGSGQPNVNCP